MSSNSDREQDALDALIVSQLRMHGCGGEQLDPDALPELSDEDRAALRSLGPDFVERLLMLASELPPPSPSGPVHVEHEQVNSEELAYGLNRAEELDQETADELALRRKEVIDRVRGRKQRESGDA